MKVFLSSTAQDLDAHRKVAEETIHQLSQQIVTMEYFGALPGTPTEECKRLACESDVVVCIVAHRYGSGITRLEVEAAHKAGKDVLVWIVADDHPWAHMREETQLADPNVFSDPAKAEEVRQRVQALFDFKAWLQKTFTVDRFTTPDDLGRKIAVALTNYVKGHAIPPVPQDRISIAHLPVTGAELFGRETELQLLDKAWENSNTNIMSFVAWGGVGKTALINRWLKQHMARDNYRGAERVYGWSFFSQGTTERAASADLFVDQALRWFGDPDPMIGSPWDKGERLARYIRQTRTLLILDGIEPLQHPPGPQEGRLKDAALQALLVELAAHQPGLCVISTRERIDDLAEFENGTVIQHELEHLSAEAGAQILRSLKVKGGDEELREAAAEQGGHAFSITLLGSYLDEVLEGDIRRRDEIANLFDDTRYGDAARRMIAAYERWLGDRMELAILRLLGLFDRPADLASIEVLRARPAIAGLTEPLQQFKGREWNQAISKLRRLKLLAEASSHELGTLDAHPLIREYFKEQLKSERVEAWREANNRLYEYLSQKAKPQPETMPDMFVLYAAMMHGCAAGKHRQVLDEIYWPRVLRNEREVFSIKKLGAAGMELAVLAGFFVVPWETLEPGLEEANQAFIRGIVGFHLQALGRLSEALQLTHAALDSTISLSDWTNGCIAAANLSEMYLNAGQISQAMDYAKQSVNMAVRSAWREQMANRTVLAEALHQAGFDTEAEAMFLEAEVLLKTNLPQFPLLHSLEGFRYLQLLLDQMRFTEVEARVSQTIQWVTRAGILLDIALDELALGTARLRVSDDPSAITEAANLLRSSVDGLRKAGYQQTLPRGLLARAELHRTNRDYERARRDLAEVLRISARAGMNLYLADYHLESSRVWIAQNDTGKAREHLATAKEMINRMGYHRRDKEVEQLEAQLA